MKKYFLVFTLFLMNFACGQNSGDEVFERISKEVETFTVDTTAVPNDRLTREIKKLREIKGGFNINEAVLYKIAEDQSKGNLSKKDADQLEAYFSTGAGRAKLENAVIRIYRKYFTFPEVKKMTKFYRSAAGRKLSQNFPLIMIQSLKSAEKIGEEYSLQK